MSCNLNKLTTYNVGRVIHDNVNGSYTAQLVRPPESCPDNVFVSKKAKIKVVEGANPELIFDVAQARPVIIVPRSEYVEEIGTSSFGFGSILFFTFLAALALLGVYLVFRRSPSLATGRSSTGYNPSQTGYRNREDAMTANRAAQQSAQVPLSQQPNAASNVTVVNNGNDGLLTGMMLGNMMSNNRGDRIIENNTTIIERESHDSNDDHSYSKDGGSGSTYSSDDDSSSSSSFSSDDDSSSSFSSDSSSDSSFSSDSGGGSFGSDD